MLYPGDEPHAPEIEALDQTNSRSFRARDPAALADGLLEVVADRETWFARRTLISENARKSYSAEVMARRFLEATDFGR